VALEGFSEPDAARVLDIDVMKLRGLVEESGRELAVEIATEVLIIEDDTFIAMELETLVEGLGHRVLGVARGANVDGKPDLGLGHAGTVHGWRGRRDGSLCAGPDDQPTIGLILCADKNDAMVRYVLDDKSRQIFASRYQLHLPSEEALRAELQREIDELRTPKPKR
jgi:hypothetical protein